LWFLILAVGPLPFQHYPLPTLFTAPPRCVNCERARPTTTYCACQPRHFNGSAVAAKFSLLLPLSTAASRPPAIAY
jgi:hypothetical protein